MEKGWDSIKTSLMWMTIKVRYVHNGWYLPLSLCMVTAQPLKQRLRTSQTASTAQHSIQYSHRSVLQQVCQVTRTTAQQSTQYSRRSVLQQGCQVTRAIISLFTSNILIKISVYSNVLPSEINALYATV